MPSETVSVSPYAGIAREKYEALIALYAENNNANEPVSFWKLGNAFDTIIDYLDTVDGMDADDVADMVVKQLDASIKVLGGYDNAWFDDFGWWSVSCQRALRRPYFKPKAASFEAILKECWSRFTSNAPYVWDRRGSSSPYDAFAPAVPGGVWNAYWAGTPPNFPGPKNGNPSTGGLTGIQNTVTNALYLMAAHRLGHTDPVARQAAEREYKFLMAWVDDPIFPLWWELANDAALMRERVSHFANGKMDSGFLKTWAWAGDQGLMMGNFSDEMLHLAPNFRKSLQERIEKLLAGMALRMTDSSGVLLSYTPSTPPDNDVADYETGSGVFWRNALYVWTTNSDMRPAFASVGFQKVLRASATLAASRPSKGLPFDELANDLAVLLAADAMLK